MKKQGVSPVIATVLLLVITVVLASIIFLWARGFLSESAVKGDRAVSLSCADAQFKAEIVPDASECRNVRGGKSAVDIDNIGNVPIYGVQVFEYNPTKESIELLIDEPFADGTITIGKSASICLGVNVAPQEAFRVVPKLLAEKDGTRSEYTCPEKDGIALAYVGI